MVWVRRDLHRSSSLISLPWAWTSSSSSNHLWGLIKASSSLILSTSRIGHPQLIWVNCSSVHHPQCKKISYVQFKPTLFQCKTIVSGTVTIGLGKKSFSVQKFLSSESPAQGSAPCHGSSGDEEKKFSSSMGCWAVTFQRSEMVFLLNRYSTGLRQHLWTETSQSENKWSPVTFESIGFTEMTQHCLCHSVSFSIHNNILLLSDFPQGWFPQEAFIQVNFISTEVCKWKHKFQGKIKPINKRVVMDQLCLSTFIYLFSLLFFKSHS